MAPQGKMEIKIREYYYSLGNKFSLYKRTSCDNFSGVNRTVGSNKAHNNTNNISLLKGKKTRQKTSHFFS